MKPVGPIHIRATVSPDPGRPPVIDSAVQSPGRLAAIADVQPAPSSSSCHGAAGAGSVDVTIEQFTSRWANLRLQNGLIAAPLGVWISTWAWGTEPSELPESPIHATTCPAVTGAPGSMPGANRQRPSSVPSSVPGVSLLTW